jgi:hypothetical protein
MAVFGTIDGKAFGNTVAVTQNDATVTKNAGDAINVGDILELINVPYIVKQVNSTTSIELHKPYVAATNNSLAASSAVRRTAPKAVAEYVIKGGDSNAYNLVFADATEQSLAVNRKRGITSPGWWLYRSFTDVEGTTRHKAECIAFVNMAASAAVGDDADDAVLADFNSVISISSQPTNQNTSSGGATFAVTAAATGQAAAYDTAANNGATGGRTAGTYAITATGGTGSGATFSVVIAANGAATITLTNGGGGYTDNDDLVLSRTGAYGGASNVTVKVNGVNNGTLTYQWQKRNSSSGRFSNVSGATSASLALSSQAAGNTGNQYRCRINNGIGATEVISNTATLTFVS